MLREILSCAPESGSILAIHQWTDLSFVHLACIGANNFATILVSPLQDFFKL